MVRQTSSRRLAPAYTLLELTLVVALLGIVAGMAAPAINTMYAHQRLDAAIDSVRGAWATCRAKATDEGRPYRFAVMLGKGNYRLAPDRDAYWSGDGRGEDDPEGQGFVKEGALPAGVTFAQQGGGGGSATLDTTLPLGSTSPQEFSKVAVFEGDGTASEDIEILFQFRGARPTVVHLRALTGAVTVRPVGASR